LFVTGDPPEIYPTRVRVGAVGYLNARPHVYGLERSPRFDVRFDVPSTCAALLHEGAIDVGLIPSIEYLRGPAEAPHTYRIVPGVAIASRGPVASVALYTTKPLGDVRSIAMDISSRTSVALARVLCAREFKIRPVIHSSGPDLDSMLTWCDAALLIGDHALFLDVNTVRLTASAEATAVRRSVTRRRKADTPYEGIEKIDLGEVWTRMTGLPFVYAFWAGRADALTADDVRALQQARDEGAAHAAEIAQAYFDDSRRQAIGARYLRDNIKYEFGADERAGLELFFRYAAEAGIVPTTQELRFY
jgi:chorismate dehydratase